MSFIKVNFDDAQEATASPAGRYMLQITSAEETKSGEKSKRPGSPMFKVTIGFPENPNTPNILQFISLPHEEDTADSSNFKVLMLKRFLTHFNVPFSNDGIDTEKLAMEMVGASADTEVTVGEPNDNGDIFNGIRIPKLRGEAQSAPRAAAGRKR